MEVKIRTLQDRLEAHKQSLVVQAGKEGHGVVDAFSEAISAALLDRTAFNSFEKVHQWTDGDCPARYSLKFDSVILNELNDWMTHFEHAKTTYEEWNNSRAALDHYREKVADLQSKERSSLSSGKALSSAMREKMMRNSEKLDGAEREFAAKREALLKEVRALRSSAGRRLDALLLRLMQWEQSWLKDMYVAVNNGYKDAIAQLQQRTYDDASPVASPSAAAAAVDALGSSSPAAAASAASPTATTSSPRAKRSTGKVSLGKSKPAASQASAFEPFEDSSTKAGGESFDPFGSSDVAPGNTFEPMSTHDDVWGGGSQAPAAAPVADDSADLWGDGPSKPAVATKGPLAPTNSSDLDDLFGSAPTAHTSGAFTAPAAHSASFDPFGEVQQEQQPQAQQAHFDPFA